MSELRVETVLEAIRAVELEMALKIDEARAQIELAIVDAHSQAAKVVRAANERGLQLAEERRQERVAAAVAEAEQSRIDAVASVSRLLDHIRPDLAALVDQMVDEVLTTRTTETSEGQ